MVSWHWIGLLAACFLGGGSLLDVDADEMDGWDGASVQLYGEMGD